MPALITLLLFDGLLKHGLQPTISAANRGSCSCRVAKSSPSTGGWNEVNLAVKSPLLPLLTNPIPHHQPRHIAVCALMQIVRPALEHGDARHLHVENLQPFLEPRHFSHEVLQAAPGPLRILGKHLPHPVEAPSNAHLHETDLNRGAPRAA